MKYIIATLFSLASAAVLADDGALRAAGYGGLLLVLFPIMGVLAILFIVAAVDRFVNPNVLSSRMMKYNGGMLMFLVFIFLSLFNSVNTLYLILIGVEVLIAVILFFNWRMKANLPPKEIKK